MSITKYKTSPFGNRAIEKVEVERETELCVWVRPSWSDGDSRRAQKRSSYDNYFDSWEEAHAFLLDKAERELNAARLQLQRAQGNHGNVVGMKEAA